MRLELIFMRRVSGGSNKVPFLLWGFSTLTHGVTASQASLRCIGVRNSRRGSMEIALGSWSRPPLLPLFLQPLGAWENNGFYRRLASLLSHCNLTAYSRTLAWMRCTLFFSAALCCGVHPWKPVHLTPSCRSLSGDGPPGWAQRLLSPNISFFFSVFQHMPTGAGGGGKGRPSSSGKKF